MDECLGFKPLVEVLYAVETETFHSSNGFKDVRFLTSSCSFYTVEVYGRLHWVSRRIGFLGNLF